MLTDTFLDANPELRYYLTGEGCRLQGNFRIDKERLLSLLAFQE